MNLLQFALLVVAGFFAALIGVVSGLASLVSYPALLLAAVPPVAANVTNTVALVAAGAGTTVKTATVLRNRGRQLVWWSLLAALGGSIGAAPCWCSPSPDWNGRSSPGPIRAFCLAQRPGDRHRRHQHFHAHGAAPAAPGAFAPENILLLGSDTRAGAANAQAGGTDESTADGVANSDTLMIAHISSDRHVTVLSIPRDTMVDAPIVQDLGRQHRATLGRHLPGRFRRQVAHQLRLLRRRPAVHRARGPGPHRAADRSGHRDRLRRVPEHGRRAGWYHRERLPADRRRRAWDGSAQRRRADHPRGAGAQPGPGPEGGRATPTPTWPASAGSKSCCPRSCSR